MIMIKKYQYLVLVEYPISLHTKNLMLIIGINIYEFSFPLNGKKDDPEVFELQGIM
jgi:hypothetical protein